MKNTIPIISIISFTPDQKNFCKLFIEFPFRLYRDVPQWVPPLRMDAQAIFNTRRHSFYRQGAAAFFLALNEHGQACGRLAVLNNQAYNRYNNEHTAFFSLFECENDLQISNALFAAGLDWARLRNLTRMEGPKGFTLLDGMGLLVKGFEHRPAYGMPYHLPYYAALVEAAGFTSYADTVSGYLHRDAFVMPEKVRKVAERVQERKGIRVVQFRRRRDFARIIPAFQQLYNNSLEGTTGTMPLSAADVKTMTDQILWLADLRLIKILMKDDTLIGFLLAYPDPSAALQRCRGRLFPFGWLDLLIEMKRTRWVNINGAAIIEQYRGMGGTAILFNEMYRSLSTGTFEHADLVQIGTDNEKMQLEMRELGIQFYKTHRLYRREIDITRIIHSMK
jgi:hypothetical protein